MGSLGFKLVNHSLAQQQQQQQQNSWTIGFTLFLLTLFTLAPTFDFGISSQGASLLPFEEFEM